MTMVSTSPNGGREISSWASFCTQKLPSTKAGTTVQEKSAIMAASLLGLAPSERTAPA